MEAEQTASHVFGAQELIVNGKPGEKPGQTAERLARLMEKARPIERVAVDYQTHAEEGEAPAFYTAEVFFK